MKITRQIGIDMGHRVPDHLSKCRNFHGHRYTIEVTLAGGLATSGEEKGMVMDFGFLKELLESEIDAGFDHSMCLYYEDDYLSMMCGLDEVAKVRRDIEQYGYATITTVLGFKLTLVDCVPTVENLAALWFDRMRTRVLERTSRAITVVELKAWETPNCFAVAAPRDVAQRLAYRGESFHVSELEIFEELRLPGASQYGHV